MSTRDDFYRDLLRFDTQLQRWDTGFDPVPFAQGRAYHAATVLGSKIWLTGGSASHEIFSHILVFDTLTLAWERVTLRCPICPGYNAYLCFQASASVLHERTAHGELALCRKGSELLKRTCHACLPHPTKKDCLLVFCGYSETSDFLNDVVLLDTARYMISLVLHDFWWFDTYQYMLAWSRYGIKDAE